MVDPDRTAKQFPLHAAGYHSIDSTDTVLDRVMSSYASSIKSIIHGRKRRLSPTASTQALLVAMHTPENNELRFATKDVATLRDLCGLMLLDPVEPGQLKHEVASSLWQCGIFHFAGHGAMDPSDASKSGLILADGNLRIAELLGMDLSKNPLFLAYLSACETGRIKDDTSIDESIHLMNAFQLAGFRHVVGTLWDVDDEICVDVARITYHGLRDGGMTDEPICLGLHNACRMLRDRPVERELENEDKSLLSREGAVATNSYRQTTNTPPTWRDVEALDACLALWTPYAHFGVIKGFTQHPEDFDASGHAS